MPRNARTHSEAQVAQIAGSIREFGFTNPVLLDGDNGVIAGHGRVLAARKLGLVEVPRDAGPVIPPKASKSGAFAPTGQRVWTRSRAALPVYQKRGRVWAKPNTARPRRRSC